jgi:hypothetical protein
LPTYAWQIRITDYAEILWKMKPLFEKRLADSMYCRLTETLDFNFRSFTIRMTVKDGEVLEISKIESGGRSPLGFNPLVFVKLLLGDKSRDELEAAYPDCRADASHRHLVDVLFPKLPSYIHSAY